MKNETTRSPLRGIISSTRYIGIVLYLLFMRGQLMSIKRLLHSCGFSIYGNFAIKTLTDLNLFITHTCVAMFLYSVPC